MLSPADILGPQGRIAARLPHYEQRPQQLAMAEAVARAIDERRHLVAEAGTGVGKSFAYLVPAILAVATPGSDGQPPNRRVVVSTHTISLQEQLLAKDLPLLQQRDPARVHRGAGQRARQLPEPAADEAAPVGAASLFHQDEEFAKLRPLVDWSQDDRRRLAGRSGPSAAAARSGTKWRATAAIAWAAIARRTRIASTIRPAAGCSMPRCWWSITRCSSATWPCGGRGQHSARL